MSESEPDTLLLRWAPIPGTAQEQFFDDDTPEANLLFTGGWGSGKTSTLCAKALKLSAINAPFPGIWLVPNWDHVEKTILPALESPDPDTGEPWFLSPGQYHYHQTKHIFTWVGGGPIWFMTAENFKGIAGPNVAWLAVDEPGSIRHEAWRNAVARVRHPAAVLRQRVASGTPEGLNWLMDMFGDPSRPDMYRVYRMRTLENTELIKHNPEYVAQVQENASEAEAQSYLEGLFVNLTGALAHPGFSEDLHWIKPVPVEESLPLRLCFDFNVNPMTIGVCQIAAGQYGPEVRVIDWVSEFGGATVESCCLKLRQRYPKGWRAGVIVYGDATGRARHVKSLKSNYQIIKETLAGWANLSERVPTVNPPVTERINAVNRLLKDAHGRTRLWVRKTQPARTCPTRELVRSFQRTIKPTGSDDIEKKSGETHTHPAEALGYLVAWEFPIQKPLVTVGEAYMPHLL
jgi:hypothetical protein